SLWVLWTTKSTCLLFCAVSFCCLSAAQAGARSCIVGLKPENQTVLVASLGIISAFCGRIGLAQQLRDVAAAKAIDLESRLFYRRPLRSAPHFWLSGRRVLFVCRSCGGFR